jgi:hypothetical protein
MHCIAFGDWEMESVDGRGQKMSKNGGVGRGLPINWTTDQLDNLSNLQCHQMSNQLSK